jgi:hypothetical protein
LDAINAEVEMLVTTSSPPIITRLESSPKINELLFTWLKEKVPQAQIDSVPLTSTYRPVSLPVTTDENNRAVVTIPEKTIQAAVTLFQKEGLVLESDKPLTSSAVKKKLLSSEEGIKLLDEINAEAEMPVTTSSPPIITRLESSPKINELLFTWLKEKMPEADIESVPLTSTYRPVSLPVKIDENNQAVVSIPKEAAQAALEIFQANGFVLQPGQPLSLDAVKIELLSSEKGIKLLDAIDGKVKNNISAGTPNAAININSTPEIKSAFSPWINEKAAEVNVSLIPLPAPNLLSSFSVITDADQNSFIVIPDK